MYEGIRKNGPGHGWRTVVEECAPLTMPDWELGMEFIFHHVSDMIFEYPYGTNHRRCLYKGKLKNGPGWRTVVEECAPLTMPDWEFGMEFIFHHERYKYAKFSGY